MNRLFRLGMIAVIAISLGACATCRRHPQACTAVAVGVGAAIIVGLSARDWNRCTDSGPYTTPTPCARH